MRKIIMLLLISFIISSTSFGYSDENEYLWAVPAVSRWSNKGIISGFTDGTFKGNNDITRADLLIIANRLNNKVERNNKRVAYDIKESDYFFDDVCTAVNKGLIDVDDNGNIRPREYATREDAMVVFATLFNLSYGNNSYEYLSEKFVDGKNVEANNMKKIAGFVEAGFITGYPDGTLRPKNNISRAEIIAMLDKAIVEIYKEGKYRNENINGSIVINDENVRINNFEIKGRVFVLDGAKDSLPIITNSNIGQGINSRIGQINVIKDNKFETATEYKEDEPFTEPVLGYIKYNKTGWTNDNVKATLKLNDDDYRIVNNSGDDDYYFQNNGEFTFECEKDGVIKRFTARVNNIDKVQPIIEASISGGTVNITISNDGMSEIVDIAYAKGDVSKNTAISGTKIENNSFTVNEIGKYTIAVEDGAENIGRLVVNIESLVAPSPTPDSGENAPSEDGSGTNTPPSGGDTPSTEGSETDTPPTGGEVPGAGGNGTDTPSSGGDTPSTEGSETQTPSTDENTQGNGGSNTETPPDGTGSENPPTTNDGDTEDTDELPDTSGDSEDNSNTTEPTPSEGNVEDENTEQTEGENSSTEE